ncbi:FAD-binding oxidoreductase [Lactiplantibacillus mudanjiangensis]|uniref:Glycolate dehydrogenase, subunit GlcD,FAD-binding protein [Lactobacillus plantarum ZJ316] n=1 Tax=Lactiplantibacillus mudanjiangensis TaxID=1296538 RepID=A0A660DZD1_9LACO|nr:FAD-linked oxidase C-terminal domain-containing protein [Lactiplantibacillus mudanjiangensis]VDG21113.1 Glycolate dehydrogenase, subunit GlcD,FAD-binding protein [Lactobacillus plantarum ZJ316] [Lactiplantibacillus mudanjiangensis]VDG22952.1 Glycolate dehydrogenase, subunit GlcD,FAD-binding protein [Lactobacillus plantarum ZJ316] [Lactiplantibacillus mudanjiangensis]VDG29190.1 Glycolate dehydrogenase, subunit GlcD,FAD-binding protein [Lactobacillus plantarum ZJ316] [Lactiplantibacillus mudanj
MTVFKAFSDDDIIADLKANVTDGQVLTDADTLQKFSFSKNLSDDDSGLALAYIEAHSTKDIQGTLKTARKFHLPVVPQAQTTSTVIGSDGIAGGLILSTAKMNRILEISKEDSLAVVEPGVVNGDLDKEARKQGMFYAPDPGSKPISGIGGNVATNAGGMSTVKYGATKDNVLGVKVVLADGREVQFGGRTLKQAFGYDLTQLMVGSEGTLGIITQVIVKLLPIPLGTPVMGMAFFDNMTALAKAVTAIRISGVYPTMLEALDGNTVIALDRYEKTHYADNSGAMLIFKLDNGGEASMHVVEDLLAKHQANHVTVTTEPKEQADLEQLRRDMLPAVFAGQNHIMEDMAVPLSQLAPLMDYIQAMGQDLGVKIYTAGHAGDGNVHPTLVWPKEETEVPEAIIKALQLMFHKTLALGGTISGEHAIGMLKNQWNNAELGEDVDQIQHQIKALFDPMGLLNPKRKIN